MDGHTWPPEGRPYKQRRIAQAPGSISLIAGNMRSLSFQASYFSLARFALSFSQSRRSSSEPTVTPPVPNNPHEVPADVINDPVDVPKSQPTQSIERSPSPAPTEVEEPEPEVILEDLKKLKIKVRDFAYNSSSSRALPPVTETFDPYRAITEYEYRVRMTPDIPVTGKTMRRLLTLGWVSMDEAKERLRQIDWQAMKEYDARDTGYPWRAVKWNTIPTAQEREVLYNNGASYFSRFDKAQASLRMQEAYEEQERLYGIEMGERAELLLRETQEREWKKMGSEQFSKGIRAKCEGDVRMGGTGTEFSARRDADDNATPADTSPTISTVSTGKKRALEHSPSTPNFAISVSTTDGPKRPRLSDDATSCSAAERPSSPPTTMSFEPCQQYPAPLQAYDPLLYPDAARIITAENRPPVVLCGDVTPPVSDDESDNEPGLRLRRKKKDLKRGLGRTLTFAQL